MNAACRVFVIAGPNAEPLAADVNAIGFKAYNLARMAAAGMPVPPAFVLGTGFCRALLDNDAETGAELRELLAANMRRIEAGSGQVFGGTRRPLLVSVRSGAKVSMPGMLETLLNVGLTDSTLHGLLRMTGNPRLVWDSYRRLIQSFAVIVHGAPAQPFDAAFSACLREAGATRARELDARRLAAMAQTFLGLHRKLADAEFPQDPLTQLEMAVRAVFRSWLSPRAIEYRRLHQLEDAMGTAVTVQRMVFGNAGGRSGSGVAFTRDPATGENRLYMDFLFNAQGEDVVSGRYALEGTGQLEAVLPQVMDEITRIAGALEAEFRDVQELEFTVQDGVLNLLQTRSGKRTALAALRIAVEQVREGLITPAEGLQRLRDVALDRLEQVRVTPSADAPVLCHAVTAGIGVAIGAIALDADRAKELARDQPVILVRHETSTEDIGGLAAASGLLTAVGGRTSHAAVVARQLDKVCLVGCADLAIDLDRRTCCIAGRTFVEGDLLCLDANSGRVFAGRPHLAVEKPLDHLDEVERWKRLCGEQRVA